MVFKAGLYLRETMLKPTETSKNQVHRIVNLLQKFTLTNKKNNTFI